jgi:hypothetical protein
VIWPDINITDSKALAASKLKPTSEDYSPRSLFVPQSADSRQSETWLEHCWHTKWLLGSTGSAKLALADQAAFRPRRGLNSPAASNCIAFFLSARGRPTNLKEGAT